MFLKIQRLRQILALPSLLNSWIFTQSGGHTVPFQPFCSCDQSPPFFVAWVVIKLTFGACALKIFA